MPIKNLLEVNLILKMAASIDSIEFKILDCYYIVILHPILIQFVETLQMIDKYNIGLKTLLQWDISEPVFYGDLVYKLKKLFEKASEYDHTIITDNRPTHGVVRKINRTITVTRPQEDN